MAHKPADLGNRLQRADLVVGRHYRDQNGLVADGIFDILDPHAAVIVDGKIGDLAALLPKLLAHGLYGRMLDL